MLRNLAMIKLQFTSFLIGWADQRVLRKVRACFQQKLLCCIVSVERGRRVWSACFPSDLISRSLPPAIDEYDCRSASRGVSSKLIHRPPNELSAWFHDVSVTSLFLLRRYSFVEHNFLIRYTPMISSTYVREGICATLMNAYLQTSFTIECNHRSLQSSLDVIRESISRFIIFGLNHSCCPLSKYVNTTPISLNLFIRSKIRLYFHK